MHWKKKVKFRAKTQVKRSIWSTYFAIRSLVLTKTIQKIINIQTKKLSTVLLLRGFNFEKQGH